MRPWVGWFVHFEKEYSQALRRGLKSPTYTVGYSNKGPASHTHLGKGTQVKVPIYRPRATLATALPPRKSGAVLASVHILFYTSWIRPSCTQFQGPHVTGFWEEWLSKLLTATNFIPRQGKG